MAKRWYILVDTGEAVYTNTRRRAIEKLRILNPGLIIDESNVFVEGVALHHEKHLAAVQTLNQTV